MIIALYPLVKVPQLPTKLIRKMILLQTYGKINDNLVATWLSGKKGHFSKLEVTHLHDGINNQAELSVT